MSKLCSFQNQVG